MTTFLLRWTDRGTSEPIEESFTDSDRQESTAEARALARYAELMVQGASCRLFEERQVRATAKASIVKRNHNPAPAESVPASPGAAEAGKEAALPAPDKRRKP